jgi:hypothetical protein
LAIRAN